MLVMNPAMTWPKIAGPLQKNLVNDVPLTLEVRRVCGRLVEKSMPAG